MVLMITWREMGAKGFLSEHSHLYEPFKKLIETMKYKPETPEQAAARTEAQVERTRKNAASWLDSAVLAPLKRVANDEMHMEAYAVLREEFLLGVPGSVEQLNDFKKSVTGRVIPRVSVTGWRFSSVCCPGCRRRNLRRLAV